MLLHKSFTYYLSLFGAALAAVSSIPEVSARIVGPADIRDNIKEVSARIVGSADADIRVKDTKSFVKVHEGDSCAGPGALCSFRDDWSRDLITFECCEGTTCGYVRGDSTFLKVCH